MIMSLRDKMQKEIMSWKGVKENPNRFGTPSFFVNDKEFAHFHNDSQMDIRIAKNLQNKLKDKKILPNPYSKSWILFNFKNEEDAKEALKFVKAVYDELK